MLILYFLCVEANGLWVGFFLFVCLFLLFVCLFFFNWRRIYWHRFILDKNISLFKIILQMPVIQNLIELLSSINKIKEYSYFILVVYIFTKVITLTTSQNTQWIYHWMGWTVINQTDIKTSVESMIHYG